MEAPDVSTQQPDGPDLRQTLFESLPDPAWVYDAETLAFLDVNDAAVARYGYSRAEFLAMTLRDIRPPEDVPVLEASLRENGPGYQTSGVFRHRAKSGSLMEVEISSHDVRHGDRPARIVVVRDVTGQRRAQRALAESEERYRDLVENAQEVIFSLDLEGRVLSMNRAAERVTGFSREEAAGRSVFGSLAPGSLERARAMLEKKLSGVSEPTTYEVELTRKDGDRITLEVNSRLVLRDGAPVAVEGIARDITERRRLEADFQQAQKMEGIGRLAGGIAHDFNNLLTAILGQAELAKLAIDDGDQPRSELDQIVGSAKRAADLTRQLLMFARKEVTRPEPVSLNELVLDIDKLLRRLIGEDVALMTMPAPGLGLCLVDRGQMEQVLVNLAVNARDAMPHGGRLTIETANVTLDEAYARQRADVAPGAHVMLAVSDSGSGITPDVLAHIFEPFFTTKEAGKGTGLGLATCYGIVRQNHGHIAVYSEAGRGSTFRVYLPRVEGIAGRAAPVRTPPDAMPAGTETLVLAEDEPRVRGLVATTLRRVGYTVLEASNGREALALARAHAGPIHLLVTDLVMPKMSGQALAEEMRQLFPGLPVLLVSGYTEDAALRAGELGQGVAFLPKPFSALELARRVRASLDERVS